MATLCAAWLNPHPLYSPSPEKQLPVSNGFSFQSLQSLWLRPDPLGGTGATAYGEEPWHGAQFRFDASSQDEYWNELMKKFSLPSNHASAP